MTSTRFVGLNITTAEQFIEAFSEPNADNVYFTFGRVQGWANDAAPITANTEAVTYNEVWKNMIGAKKITGNDISLAIRRINWEANTIYSHYDHANANILNDQSNFYVVTSEYNIYKCLFNNYGANSTVEPTAINANNVTQTSDGYIWKYMFSLSSADRLKFTTSQFIPVRTLTLDNGSIQWDVQEATVDGAIYAAEITNGGTGYSNASNVVVTFSGDGVSATGTVGINNVSNTVNSISMVNYGQDYTEATVSISGGGGSGANARALISPIPGHGKDPTYELVGRYVVINMRLNSDEDDIFSIENQFRQVALIKNPLKFGTNNVSSNNVISQTLDLTVVGDGVDYEADEIVYQGASLSDATFRARVLEYNSAESLLKVVDYSGSPTNDTLIGANTTTAKFISSIDNPELERFSGKLLYVNNIEPIARDLDQVEDFKIILKF